MHKAGDSRAQRHACAHVHTRMRACTCTCIHARTCALTHNLLTFAKICVYVCACIPTCTRTWPHLRRTQGVCMADVSHLWQRPNNLTSKNHARTSTAVAEFRQNGSTKAWRLLFALPARGLNEASPNPLSAPRWCDRVVASRPDEKLVSGHSPDRSIALCGPSNNSNACTCTRGLSDRTAKTR